MTSIPQKVFNFRRLLQSFAFETLMFSLFEFFVTFRGFIFCSFSCLPIAIGDRFERQGDDEGRGATTMFGGKFSLLKFQAIGMFSDSQSMESFSDSQSVGSCSDSEHFRDLLWGLGGWDVLWLVSMFLEGCFICHPETRPAQLDVNLTGSLTALRATPG